MACAAVALLRQEQFAVKALPVALLVRRRDDLSGWRVLARAASLMTVDAELGLMAHGAVRRVGTRADLVIALDELVRVVLGNQLESWGMTLVAFLGGNQALALMLKTMAAITPLHVGALGAAGRVPELGVAHLALVRAGEVHCVCEDQPALRHVGRPGREDLDRGRLGALADH